MVFIELESNTVTQVHFAEQMKCVKAATARTLTFENLL
jgi:hypothetical protein